MRPRASTAKPRPTVKRASVVRQRKMEPQAAKAPADAASAREEQLYGLRATLAAARHRGADIVRAYVAEDLVRRDKAVGSLLSKLSSSSTAYHLVSPLELDRIARTVHHEGIVLLLRARTIPNADEVLKKLAASGSKDDRVRPWQRTVQPPLLLVHGVRNAHNIGAIVRSAAFFGVNTIFASPGAAPEPLGLFSPASYRMAEGAMEGVKLVPLASDSPKELSLEVDDDGWAPIVPEHAEPPPPTAISALTAVKRLHRAGYTIVATSSSAPGRVSLFDIKLQGKLRSSPLVLLFGSEATGLSKALLKESSAIVEVPGRGDMSSLNVAHSVTAFLTEISRIQERKF